MDENDKTGEAAQRLGMLHSLHLASTQPDRAFDLIAEAARNAAGADGGYVAFFGDDQIWLKAAVGDKSPSISRLESLCGRVVRTGETQVMAYAPSHEAHAPTGQLGALAGVPIIVQGRAVGAVCVTSGMRRAFTAAMLSQINFLALILADRLEIRRENLFLSQLFDGTSDAVLIVDDNQTIMHWNAAAEALLGYAADEALGRHLTMIIPEHLRAQHERGFRRLCNGGRPTMSGAVEVPALRRSGEQFPASLSLSTWQNNGRTMVGAIIRDISDREALAQARLASEAKTRFLANMSHEIRTPLNGILGLGDVLSRTPLAADQASILRSMTGAARTLEALLGDVLDLARLEEGVLQLLAEPFDLNALLCEVGDLHRPAAEAKGLRYEVEALSEAVWVSGDPVRLKQVLGNLLSNGVKFTDNGAITLSVTPRAQGWRFEVKDTGVGFDGPAKARIFERFAQADDSITRRYGGSGLGLSICLELVRAMGGQLDAASSPNQGSCFAFEIPLPSAPPPAVVRGPVLEGRGVRILLAEDHPINRKVVELILAEVGAQLVSVCDGREAVKAYETEVFDLVLMDMQMPLVDGLTATRQIRARERALGLRACPIIMLTANVLPEHLRASFEAGADRHLGKPIEAARLFEAIEDVLTGSLARHGQKDPGSHLTSSALPQ